MRGGEADDALSKMEFDDARGIWVHARMKALESADAAAAVESEITAIGNPVVIISPAAVSSKPVGQEGGLHLGDVIFQALVSGLAFALGAPYLLELAFPRRLRRKRPEVETWAEEIDHPGFAEWPANG